VATQGALLELKGTKEIEKNIEIRKMENSANFNVSRITP
jgi:hypothetical protein